jgi:hypothetical protein
MDADDIALPDRLAKQVAFMDAHPEVVLLGGAYELIDDKGRLLTTIRQPADDATLQSILLRGSCPICQPLAMFRRSAYEKTMGYRAEFYAEDIDLWLQLGEVGEIACLPDVLLQYRHTRLADSPSVQPQIDVLCVELGAVTHRLFVSRPAEHRQRLADRTTAAEQNRLQRRVVGRLADRRQQSAFVVD